MTHFRDHIFVCLNARASDDPKGSCAGSGAEALFEKLRFEVRGIPGVRVNKAGCLGRCAEGPVMVRYPSGEWLTHANAESCKALAEKIRADLEER